MTREEAIAEIKYYMESDSYADAPSNEACKMEINALRLVSREQVERMQGEWVHTHSTDNFWTDVWKCSYCGFEDDNGDCFGFCPECGQPKTDEAVEMVMERMEELKDAGD